jgi:tetratricopeptide (TPR) repeat protein
MRTWITIGLVVLIALGLGGRAAAQEQGQARTVAAHLVLAMSQGGVAEINRMDWDVNAFAPLALGEGVRSNDYIEVSGDTSLAILCADLQLIEQRGSEVPPCNQYIDTPMFSYTEDPVWRPSDAASTIVVFPPDLALVPVEISDPGAFNQSVLTGGDLDQVVSARDTILDLSVPGEAKAYALSRLYRNQDMIFDALGVLLPDLECTARRAFVEPPGPNERLLFKSPAVYLHAGEMFQMLGQTEDAVRYYTCAADLADATGDTANLALAFARLGNATEEPGQKISFYQQAIDTYAALNAPELVNGVLEICGRGNCSVP